MTNPPTLAARLAFGAFTASLALAAPAVAAETPVAVTDASTQSILLPDDVRFYSTIGEFTARRPILGADGSLTWFYSRQRAVDDGRALGTIAIPASAIRANPTPQPTGGPTFDPIKPVLGAIDGTVALRGQDGYQWEDATWRNVTALATDAVAWRGATWILDRRETPRPARVALVALRDGAGGRIVARYPKGFTPSNVIPTDRGLRAIGGWQIKVGNRSTVVPAITAPGSTKPIRVKVASGITAAAPLAGGALLVTGTSTRGSLPDPVLIVDRRGRARRLADRRDPSAAFQAGRAGMAPIAGGILTSEQTPPADYYAENPLDKSSLVIRDARGRVTLRRAISALEYPGAAACKVSGVVHSVLRVSAGPDGAPMVTTACGKSAVQPWGERRYTWIQSTMVGLNPDLTVRWWRPAPEVRMSDYSADACGSQQTDAAGHLALVRCSLGGFQAVPGLTSVTIPGIETPPTGRLRTSTRVGKQAVRASITCRIPVGTVCSGTVRVTANGQLIGSAEYALPGRPGALQGELDRQISTAVPLPKRYSVSLQPRS